MKTNPSGEGVTPKGKARRPSPHRRGRGRKTAVVPAENVRLRRELDAHNARILFNSIVPDEVVLAWRRDYLDGKTAQEWVIYAKELNDICGNIHTGDSCVVDPGV
jgi:hypothetical protein